MSDDLDKRFNSTFPALRPGDLSHKDDSRRESLTVEEFRTSLDRVVTRLDQIADKFVNAVDDLVARLVIVERRMDANDSWRSITDQRLAALEGGRGKGKRK